MRVMLALGCTAALIAVAACNRDDAPAGNSAETETEGSANASANVAAPGAPPADVAGFMHDRHERYEDLGKAMKAINRELKASAPSVDTIRRNADQIARFAQQAPSLFPAGTGPETGHRTRAKAEIWSDAEGFQRAHASYLEQVQRFQQIAQGGDVNAIRPAAAELGKSCGNCHDRYRAREHP